MGPAIGGGEVRDDIGVLEVGADDRVPLLLEPGGGGLADAGGSSGDEVSAGHGRLLRWGWTFSGR